jgi:hypothetical protein
MHVITALLPRQHNRYQPDGLIDSYIEPLDSPELSIKAIPSLTSSHYLFALISVISELVCSTLSVVRKRS